MDERGLWRERYAVQSHLVDRNAVLRPDALFSFLQQTAEAQVGDAGCGYTGLRTRGLAWVLGKISLEMDVWPGIFDRLTVTTWPGARRRFLYPRSFLIENADDGRCCGRAVSLWVLLDLNTRKPLTAPPEGLSIPECDRPDALALPRSVQMLTAKDGAERFVRQLTPLWSDLDPNDHVNNARYLQWLTDSFPIDRLLGQAVGSLSVAYHREIRPGQRLRLCLAQRGADFTMEVCKDGAQDGTEENPFVSMAGKLRAL